MVSIRYQLPYVSGRIYNREAGDITRKPEANNYPDLGEKQG